VNKDLYNKKVKVPDEIREHMRNSFSSVSSESNDEGHKRNKELQGSEEITYQQLKRIKNFFDTQSGNTDYMDDKKQSTPFILNGGRKMKRRVNSTLDLARDVVSGNKKIKTDTAMIGSHYRDTDSVNIRHNTDDVKIKTSHQKKISESEYIYEIKKMQNIINIFDKNKELCQTDNKSPQS